MCSRQDGTHSIDAAFGHGEYVVNSKGPCDRFFVSRLGLVYPTRIAKKPTRLKPLLSESEKEKEKKKVAEEKKAADADRIPPIPMEANSNKKLILFLSNNRNEDVFKQKLH